MVRIIVAEFPVTERELSVGDVRENFVPGIILSRFRPGLGTIVLWSSETSSSCLSREYVNYLKLLKDDSSHPL